MKITTSVEEITPTMASDILKVHYDSITKGDFRQRTVSPITVSRFAADMKGGLWLLSPQPISFDEAGNLIDGQHRLEAVRASGVPCEFTVSRGWPVGKVSDNGSLTLSTIDVLDRGRTRSVGSQLQLHGLSNPNAVASSITSAVYVAYGGQKMSLSYPQVVKVLKTLDMEKHINSIIHVVNSGQQAFTRAGRVVGPLAFYHSVRPTKAKEFARALVDLSFQPGTGPHVFTHYILSRGKRKTRGEAPQRIIIRALCNAIKYWDAGETVRHITDSPQGARWLADQNPKLRDNIRNLLGPRRISRK